MPSDPQVKARGGWEWLHSQGLGVFCGQATVLLLAAGSVVLSATRDTGSAAIAMDDLRGFFDPPAAIHVWLYLLLPVLALYALNTTLATWRSVTAKWRNGVRAPHLYAPAVVHAAFLTGLLAHGVGGLGGAELGQVVVGPGWGALGDGRQARLAQLEVTRHPDGRVRQVHASVELRGADGAVQSATVRFNQPLSRGLGSDLLLLIRPESLPSVRLVRGNRSCEASVAGSCELDGLRAELLLLHPPPRHGEPPLARLRAERASDGTSEVFWLEPGGSHELADGSLLWLADVESRPAIRLQRRHAPGDPLALLASVLLAAGLVLMWRRFARP